jgi:two-component system sensor histidine kinase UhpB
VDRPKLPQDEHAGAAEGELREEMAWLESAYNLQVLARRLVEAEELQRHRIAAELHDRVGQTLSALNINLDIALGLLPKENIEARLRIADSLALVDGALQTIEDLMADLRPPLLDEYGLSAALGLYVEHFSKRTGLGVSVDDPLEAGRALPRVVAIALFRIAQEALANVAKHAEAKKVRVFIEKHDNEFIMEIADDGRGFDRAQRLAQSQRWGMTTMQERAAAIGGELEVQSSVGGGTSVRVRVREREAQGRA